MNRKKSIVKIMAIIKQITHRVNDRTPDIPVEAKTEALSAKQQLLPA